MEAPNFGSEGFIKLLLLIAAFGLVYAAYKIVMIIVYLINHIHFF